MQERSRERGRGSSSSKGGKVVYEGEGERES